MKRQGIFIVIEGTDGSGKGTQFKLLVRALKQAGKRVAIVDVPQYGKPSARLVERYLTGKLGRNPEAVSPYDASLFYAVDRFALAPKVRQWLSQGKLIVANRYTLSNAGHQGGKIARQSERRTFWQWLFHTEYEVLDIPKPDLTIILHMPAAQAQRLVGKKKSRTYLRGVKRDIHEGNLVHLKAAERAYLELAQMYRFPVVECVERGRLLTPQEVHAKVWQIVRSFYR